MMNKIFSIKGGLTFEMVYVEGDSFQMGETIEQLDNSFNEFFDKLAVKLGAEPEKKSQKVKCDDRALPHLVSLDDFFIAQTVVTQQLWDALMGDNPSEFKGPHRPVECVSWFDCHKFISKLNARTQQQFRLPTEAEWEYAARGGNKSKGYKYSGSNNYDEVAWHFDNAGYGIGMHNSAFGTHPVGTKAPNELGIYDMSGNVWEWCEDTYDDFFYQNSPSINPLCFSKGIECVHRGGSWYDPVWCCRTSHRSRFFPSCGSNNLGFRLALSIT